MRTIQRYPHTIRICRQRGVVLIVSLLILLVMTLIGVVAMNTTTLEERMAGNTRLRDLAFQAAEAALRDGEADLQANEGSYRLNFDAACDSGLCQPATDGTPVWDSISWNSQTSVSYGHNTGASALTDVATQPRYILEIMPQSKKGGSEKNIQIYRVTSRATAENGNVVVMLQSTYRP